MYSLLECKGTVNQQLNNTEKRQRKYKMKSEGWWQLEGLMQRADNIHLLEAYLILQMVFKTYLRVIVTVMMAQAPANITSKVKAHFTRGWSQNVYNSSAQPWNDSLINHRRWNPVLRLDQDIMSKSQVRRVVSEFQAQKYHALKSTLASQQVRIDSMIQSRPKAKHSTLWHPAQVHTKPKKTSLMVRETHGERMEYLDLQRDDSFQKEINLCTHQDQELTSHQIWSVSRLKLPAKLREAAQCSYPRLSAIWPKSQLKTQGARLSPMMINCTRLVRMSENGWSRPITRSLRNYPLKTIQPWLSARMLPASTQSRLTNRRLSSAQATTSRRAASIRKGVRLLSVLEFKEMLRLALQSAVKEAREPFLMPIWVFRMLTRRVKISWALPAASGHLIRK